MGRTQKQCQRCRRWIEIEDASAEDARAEAEYRKNFPVESASRIGRAVVCTPCYVVTMNRLRMAQLGGRAGTA